MLTSFIAVMSGTRGFPGLPPIEGGGGETGPTQFFALLSTEPGYADAIAAMPDVVQLGDAVFNADLKIISSTVTEATINSEPDLADLRQVNYPTMLCQHRWLDDEAFKALGGYHMIGESENSFEGVAGRPPMIFIRRQQNKSATGDNYGTGDGSTDFNAANGLQDPVIDVGNIGDVVWNKGRSYVVKDGVHCRFGNLIGGGSNPDFSPGIFNNGLIAVEDTGGAAIDKIYIYAAWDILPGMVWGSYTLWEQHSNLLWEQYDADKWVNGAFNNNGAAGQSFSQGTGRVIPEADIDDITQDAITLSKRHLLKGKLNLSDLDGDNGRSCFYNQGDGDEIAIQAAHVFDGSTHTNVTAQAQSAPGDTFEAFALDAPDGAYLAVVTDEPHSGFLWNIGVNVAGATIEPRYSNGSGTMGAFTGIFDPTNGLTTGTFDTWIQFNPKSDWVQDTVNGSTGYVFYYVKTGGTVTQACTIDQIRARPAACFIHRWNDGAPTRGLCHWEPGPGFKWVIDGNDNVEFVRMRQFHTSQHSRWDTCDNLTITGGQYINIGDMRWLSGGSFTVNLRAADYGENYYSLADHLHTSPMDPFIQKIIGRIIAGQNAGISFATHGVDPNPAAFDNLENWCDFAFVTDGPYASGAESWGMNTGGAKVRHPGATLLNDIGDTLISVGGVDDHGFAYYGNKDHAANIYTQFAVENGRSCADFYAQANGSNDAPVSGSSSMHRNAIFHHCYFSGVGNQDSHSPHGIIFENDPDVGHYDDGTGGNVGNKVFFCGSKDQRDPSDNSGSSFAVTSSDDLHQFWYNYVDNPGNSGAFNTVGGFSGNGPRSTNAISFDGAATFVNLTDNLKDTGNTTSDLFQTGAAGEVLYLGVVARFINSYTFNIVTGGVGSPTLSFKYFDGSVFQDVAGLSDTTSGLTTTGTIKFNRPVDAATFNVNGKTIFVLAITIESGSFSTIPQANEISTYRSAGSIDMQFNLVENIDIAAGCRFFKMVHNAGGPFDDSGIIIDKNNIIQLSVGQDASTHFYEINGVATHPLSSWQGLSKPALTNPNLIDSEFGVDNQLLAA